jgi:hypothetical protein
MPSPPTVCHEARGFRQLEGQEDGPTPTRCKDAFPHAKLTRSPKGVLGVVLQTNGDTLVFNGASHEEFVDSSIRSARVPEIA